MSRALAGLEPVKSKPVIKWLAEPEPIPEKRPVETSLLDLIAGGHTVIITELDPPKTLDLDRYFKAARRLADAGSECKLTGQKFYRFAKRTARNRGAWYPPHFAADW